MNLPLPACFAATTAPEPDLFTQLLSAPPATPPAATEILFAIVLSFNALVAWTYKRTYRGTRYSQDYVHTLLILGTVVTLVILVVMGNLATAFGMFAAFSIIRFRRNVGQSRDIGFIFLAMATGLAVGARQYLLAGVTVPLVCAFVFLLARANLFSSFKGSHLLRVRVGTDVDADQAFAAVFTRHLAHHVLKSVETVQAGLMTELTYEVTLKDGGAVGEFRPLDPSRQRQQPRRPDLRQRAVGRRGGVKAGGAREYGVSSMEYPGSVAWVGLTGPVSLVSR